MSTLKVRFSAPHLPKAVNLRIWISLIRENEQQPPHFTTDKQQKNKTKNKKAQKAKPKKNKIVLNNSLKIL